MDALPLLLLLVGTVAAWPNPCSGLNESSCVGKQGCTPCGYNSFTQCMPAGQEWCCSYGLPQYCNRPTMWSCANATSPGKGCYCVCGSKASYGKCDCQCPPVSNCLSHQYITCYPYGDVSQCSKCRDGFRPSVDNTTCVRVKPTVSPSLAS
eukprot:Sspe_Gene.110269::Locus_90698_Transcript_1_1_Confidence_1.000_Length_768::g.110269::m.110269